jgi:hypothetical protein
VWGPDAAVSNEQANRFLIQHSVAAATQASFEYSLLVTVRIQRRLCCAENRTITGSCTSAAAYRAGSGTDNGTSGRTFGGAHGDLDLFGVAFTFLPVTFELLLIDALHIDYGVGMRGARSQKYAGGQADY